MNREVWFRAPHGGRAARHAEGLGVRRSLETHVKNRKTTVVAAVVLAALSFASVPAVDAEAATVGATTVTAG